MKNPIGVSVVAGLIGAAVLSLAACGLHRPRGAGRHGVVQEVTVMDHEHHEAIEGASVMVLSAGGRRLADAKTDSQGVARLMVSVGEVGTYLIAEKDGFYLTGTRWSPNAEHYVLEMIVGSLS
jgi:hypothetical protein